ncbi:MAG: PhzF family phenazine biosynthesis protein [Chthoniobacterales bacterium]
MPRVNMRISRVARAVPDPAATAYARFFNPTTGISEDSAIGTAAGPLAAQLVAKGIVPDGSAVIIGALAGSGWSLSR